MADWPLQKPPNCSDREKAGQARVTAAPVAMIVRDVPGGFMTKGGSEVHRKSKIDVRQC